MSQRVRIQHPGYKTANTLFYMPASDGTHQNHAHYATIFTACSILIDNRRDHWLSTSLTGEPKAKADEDGLLKAGDYYLHVPVNGSDTKVYPIVPNFRAWRYPHGSLPALWNKASKIDEDRARGANFSSDSIAIEQCRITNRRLEVDNAHIIPTSEKLWFVNNGMEEYGDLLGRSGEIIADSLANLLRLRCDAHRLWDKLHFSIVPMEDDNTEDEAAWFTQALVSGEELYTYWHRQKLGSLAGRPPQYLFARFAWDMFPKVHTILHSGQERYLTVCGMDGNVETRQYSGTECRQFTARQGPNRSASPTKRARSETNKYPTDLDERQCEEGFKTSGRGSVDSDDADSAVAGVRKVFEGRKHNRNLQAECEWYRYVRGDDNQEEDRGRKRFKP